MVSNHVKRLAAPKTWQIMRKNIKFVTKQASGPHSTETGIPLNTLLKEILQFSVTTKETKKILNGNEVRVDGKVRRDVKFPVGIFDTVDFAKINEYFRVVLNKKGKIDLVKIKKDEALIKPCKIIGKTIVKGKLQLNFYDGNNIIVNTNSYKVGDTIILSLPGKKILQHLKLDKKAFIFLTGGKHIGEIGSVEDIIENKIIFKDQKGNLIETSKKYAFVVGDIKPLITLE